MPEFLDDILEGNINPGRVFDFTTDLNGIEEAYAGGLSLTADLSF